MGMRGRCLCWVQTILLAGEGGLVLVFANSGTLSGAIIVMIFFSLLVQQAAEGSSYDIVPYVVDPPATGSIAGVVGAGGTKQWSRRFRVGFPSIGIQEQGLCCLSWVLLSFQPRLS